MKRTLIAIAFLLTTPATVLCRQAARSAGDTAEVVRAVMKLEGKWVRAVLRRDAKALGRILADDYIGIGSDGEVRDKARTLAELKSAAVGFKSFTQEGFDVRYDGNTATVTGRATVTALVEEQAVSSRFSYTRVYVRRKGGWQVARSSTTRVDE